MVMPPRDKKRRGPGQTGRPRKKPALDPSIDPIAVKCEQIVEALASSESLPETTAAMLATCICPCLLTYQGERHHFQESVVEMVGEALAGVEATLLQSIEKARAVVDRASTERQSREAALKEAEDRLIQLEEEVELRKQQRLTANAALDVTQTAIANAESEWKEADVARVRAIGEKEEIETALREHLARLKEGAEGIDRKAETRGLLRVTRKFESQKSMVEALRWALQVAPSARGPFDELAIAQMEDSCRKRIEELSSLITEAEPATAEPRRRARREEMEADVAETRRLAEAAAVAYGESRRAKMQGKAFVKVAQDAVRNYFTDLQATADALDSHTLQLSKLRQGALAAFAELKNRARPGAVPSAPPGDVTPAEVVLAPVRSSAAVGVSQSPGPQSEVPQSPMVSEPRHSPAGEDGDPFVEFRSAAVQSLGQRV